MIVSVKTQLVSFRKNVSDTIFCRSRFVEFLIGGTPAMKCKEFATYFCGNMAFPENDLILLHTTIKNSLNINVVLPLSSVSMRTCYMVIVL